MWELIQPLDDESVYAFPRRERRGVHHIAVAIPSFDETVAAQAMRGTKLVLSVAGDRRSNWAVVFNLSRWQASMKVPVGLLLLAAVFAAGAFAVQEEGYLWSR